MAAIEMTILTPYKVIYKKEVDHAVLRTTQGEAAVYPGHEPYMTVLDNGMVRGVSAAGESDSFVVMGGCASFVDDRLLVLSPIADVPELIAQTVEEMIAARTANETLEREVDLEIQMMENSMRRALVHMDISSYSILKGKDEKLD